MKALFPTFRHSLQSLWLCSCFPPADSAFSAYVDAGEKTIKADFKSTAGDAWIRIKLGRFDKQSEDSSGKSPAGFAGHFQVNCGLYSSSKARRSDPKDRREASRLLKLFAAQKTGKVCAEGIFRAKKNEIPKEGIADLMLRISTEVGKATLTLTEAGFSVSDHPPYEKLAWRLRPRAGDANDLEIRILTYSDVDKTNSNLETLCQLMWRGIEEMILESTPNGKE
jgi:hypothetical protein